jgi:Zn finger protein HypA/HybF involved in hydrogenase expression
VNLKTALGVIAAVLIFLGGAVLLFFAVVFSIASSISNQVSRLNTAILMFAGAISLFIVGSIIFCLVMREPKTVVQKLEVSGEMKAVALKCPNCSASVDASQIKTVSGVPYATCPYCGHMFEVAEEPKW